MIGNPWSFVIHMEINELHQAHLITGAPHGVNPSLLDVTCVYTSQMHGVLLFNEKYVYHSHAYI